MPPKVHPMETDEAQRALRDALRDPLKTNTPLGNTIVIWVVGIFHLLIALIEALLHEVTTRIKDLEDDVDAKETTSEVAPQATTSAATTTPSCHRCTKCHARGHVNSDCCTTDPAAMWKRIAANQKRKKTARDDHATAMTHPTFPFAPILSPFLAPYLTAPDPQAFATNAATNNRSVTSIKPIALLPPTPLLPLSSARAQGKCWKFRGSAPIGWIMGIYDPICMYVCTSICICILQPCIHTYTGASIRWYLIELHQCCPSPNPCTSLTLSWHLWALFI